MMNPSDSPGFTTYQPCHPRQAVNSLSLSFINYRMGIITRFMSYVAVRVKYNRGKALRIYNRCSISISQKFRNLEV